MITEAELTEARNLALQKIGRNLVNFQRAEICLKLLLKALSFRGSLSELKMASKQPASKSRIPMGVLADKFVRGFLQEEPESPTAPVSHSEPWFSMTLKLEGGPEIQSHWKQELRALAKERNRLAHTMLESFNEHSTESCHSLGVALDAQMERVLPTIRQIQDLVRALNEIPDDIYKSLQASATSSG